MGIIEVFSIIAALLACFAYVNLKFFKLPESVAITLAGISMTACLFFMQSLGWDLQSPARELLLYVDFTQTFLHGFLSFLLFAGAMRIRWKDIKALPQRELVLWTVGHFFNFFIFFASAWWLSQALGLHLRLLFCVGFAALLCTSDLSVSLNVAHYLLPRKEVKSRTQAESLIGAVIGLLFFGFFLGFYREQPAVSDMSTIMRILFLKPILSAMLGLALGMAIASLLSHIDNFQVEVLMSLAVIGNGFSISEHLGYSGVLTVLFAALFLGGRTQNISSLLPARSHLEAFWDLQHDLMSTLLFILLGLEVLVIPFKAEYLYFGLATLLLMILARMVTLLFYDRVRRGRLTSTPHLLRVLVLSGSKCAVPVALALTFPLDESRDPLIFATYVVIVGSALLQGFTLRSSQKMLQLGFYKN